MDTTAKSPEPKPRGRKKNEALIEGVAQPQLVLRAVDLIKVNAERLLASEQASKGVYTLSQKCRHIIISGNPDTPEGTFQYEMKLEGFIKGDKESKKHEKKSFSIGIELEALFGIMGGPINNHEVINSLTPKLVTQVHAIGVSRLIRLASDLGYPGVRPELGLPNESVPVFEIDPATPIPLK